MDYIWEEEQEQEQQKTMNDIRYLQKHHSFQKHRLTREKILNILHDKKITFEHYDRLFIISNGRCVGHLIHIYPNLGLHCLQCGWTAHTGLIGHCCCQDNVISALPLNFYLGCDGQIKDYLIHMEEKSIENYNV